MKKRFEPVVLCLSFLCAAMILLLGNTPLFAQGGISVDARGVVTRYAALDVGKLTNQQLNAAKAANLLSKDISAKSSMRCVSLNGMEKTILAADGKITDEMKYLAGIQRITHVFYFPESSDIVIAGPAEGWYSGSEGAMVGLTTSQPVCELQHLVTALRAYGPGRGEWNGIVGCSIDPTQEGNVELQRFQRQIRGMNPREFARGVQQNLGMQVISVDGIPASTHAAQMMVAADYRMKLLGLGKDEMPRRMGLRTFIDNTEANAENALFRWFFVPDYESVILTEDRSGIQLVGDGVKLLGEIEVVSATGERIATTNKLDRGSAAFTRSFTQLYPRIAKEALVFAQLRNWIDMLVCAAHIQRENFYGKSGWSMEFFGNEEKYPLETFVAPKEVEAVVGLTQRGRVWLAPVGGGIVINAEQALEEGFARWDKDGKIAGTQKQIGMSIPEGIWWWDVR